MVQKIKPKRIPLGLPLSDNTDFLLQFFSSEMVFISALIMFFSSSFILLLQRFTGEYNKKFQGKPTLKLFSSIQQNQFTFYIDFCLGKGKIVLYSPVVWLSASALQSSDCLTLLSIPLNIGQTSLPRKKQIHQILDLIKIDDSK